MFTHAIKINQFYLKLNKTKQLLHNKRYKNITVLIYLMTNSVKFMQQTTSPLSEGDSSVCN